MTDAVDLATGTAAALLVKRALTPLLDSIAGGVRNLFRVSGDGCPDGSQRFASYAALMDAIIETRGDLGLFAGAKMTPVGAAWTWPVYLSAFHRFPQRSQTLVKAMLAVAVDGRGPALDAASDACLALSEAIQSLPVAASRAERAAANTSFASALTSVDEALIKLAHVVREDLGHGAIEKAKGRQVRSTGA